MTKFRNPTAGTALAFAIASTLSVFNVQAEDMNPMDMMSGPMKMMKSPMNMMKGKDRKYDRYDDRGYPGGPGYGGAPG